MVEIHIPSNYSYNATVGVWEGSSTNPVGKQLYLGKFNGQKIMKFNVDEALFRIRCKGFMPVEMVCTGKTRIIGPLMDTVCSFPIDYTVELRPLGLIGSID